MPSELRDMSEQGSLQSDATASLRVGVYLGILAIATLALWIKRLVWPKCLFYQNWANPYLFWDKYCLFLRCGYLLFPWGGDSLTSGYIFSIRIEFRAAIYWFISIQFRRSAWPNCLWFLAIACDLYLFLPSRIFFGRLSNRIFFRMLVNFLAVFTYLCAPGRSS